MYHTTLTVRIRQHARAFLLLLVALGQLAAAAHALEHGIADQVERCATCVHLDQGSQVPSSAVSAAIEIERPFEQSGERPTVASNNKASYFDARAPPL